MAADATTRLSPAARLALMYTNYNVVLVLLRSAWPAWAVELLRANSLLILLCVLVFEIRHGWDAAGRILETMVPQRVLRATGPWFPVMAGGIVDVVMHWLPVVLVGGLPRAWWSMPAAALAMCAWYALVQRMVGGVQNVYMPVKDNGELDRMVLRAVPALALVSALVLFCCSQTPHVKQ